MAKRKRADIDGVEVIMTAEVRRANNGFILKAKTYAHPAGEIVCAQRHEDEVECFADFLRVLDEHLGPATSRYSEKRIYIRVEPGDKFVGKAE
jgi:TolB-like protein